MSKKLFFVLPFLCASLTVMSCKETKTADTAKTDETQTPAMLAGEMTIVYVNTDTLINHYTLFTEMRTAYEEKATKAQSELERKGKSFERDMLQFQEQVTKGLITRAQAAEKEENLQRTQQTLMQYRDNLLAELSEEEQVMLNNINHNIQEFIKEYNAEKNYTLILSTNAMTGTVLLGHPSLDITMDVVAGLNKKHAESKTKK